MIVTITAKEGNKIIERFDVVLPSKAKYIAQDRDGKWYYYWKIEPFHLLTAWGNCLNWDYLRKGKPNPSWRESLICVEDI